MFFVSVFPHGIFFDKLACAVDPTLNIRKDVFRFVVCNLFGGERKSVDTDGVYVKLKVYARGGECICEH